MISNWLTTLDAFESHLDLQAKLVEGGRYDEVAAFATPADLPPLPRILVTRASELLGRSMALIERAGAIRDDTSQRLAQSRHPAIVRSPASAFVDQQA